MGTLAPRTARALDAFAAAVVDALGPEVLCVAVYGTAVTGDWSPDHSDVNTTIVVRRVTPGVLDALAPLVADVRGQGFALPLVMDPDYLAHARDVFPMELDDIRRAHRVLHGTDAFGAVAVTRAALRHECEHDARAKLLRLRTAYLRAGTDTRALERLCLVSLSSILCVLRHLVRLHRDVEASRFAEAVAAGEALLGPLPTLRTLLAWRAGDTVEASRVRTVFAEYLGEVERIVAAIDATHA